MSLNHKSLRLGCVTSDTVECYNLRKNEWRFVTNMVEPHYGHAGTVHGDLMYISGKATLCTTPSQVKLTCTAQDHIQCVHTTTSPNPTQSSPRRWGKAQDQDEDIFSSSREISLLHNINSINTKYNKYRTELDANLLWRLENMFVRDLWDSLLWPMHTEETYIPFLHEHR